MLHLAAKLLFFFHISKKKRTFAVNYEEISDYHPIFVLFDSGFGTNSRFG
jgi:hypothetical protein